MLLSLYICPAEVESNRVEGSRDDLASLVELYVRVSHTALHRSVEFHEVIER